MINASAASIAPDLIPGDAAELFPQPPHWPLVWMLTLTRLSAGAFALLPFVAVLAQPLLALGALVSGALGLAVATLQLGKPLKASRSFLGLRQSWLSREIVVFGLFLALAFLTTTTHSFSSRSAGSILNGLTWTAALIGLLGVFCSAMVYHDTRPVFWRGVRSIGRFFGTTAVLGLAAAWLAAELNGISTGRFAAALAFAATIKLAAEHRLLRRAGHDSAEKTFPRFACGEEWSLARSAVLMREQFGLVTRTRFFLGTRAVSFCHCSAFCRWVIFVCLPRDRWWCVA